MRRIAGLDVLRGIAIALVLLRHAAPDLRRFYARRARRLVPALVVVLAVLTVVTLTLDPLGDRGELPKTLAVALTWTGNLPCGHASDATFHLWTLATEEQFYLVWPAVLLLLGPRRGLVVAALGTTALAVLAVVPLRGHALTYLAGGPAIAALTAVLLLSWRTRTEVTAPALRALAWLGTVSYGAYLWSYPLTLWLRPHAGPAAGWLAAVLTVVAAAVSWYAVERPLQSRPHRPAAPEPVVAR